MKHTQNILVHEFFFRRLLRLRTFNALKDRIQIFTSKNQHWNVNSSIRFRVLFLNSHVITKLNTVTGLRVLRGSRKTILSAPHSPSRQVTTVGKHGTSVRAFPNQSGFEESLVSALFTWYILKHSTPETVTVPTTLHNAAFWGTYDGETR